MRENRKPHVIALRTAAVLLILVLFTSSIVSGRFARYTSSATGHDGARVAKFLVTEEGVAGEMIKVRISPGETAKHQITVRNDSEVTIEYAVSALSEYENLPLSFSIADEGSAGPAAVLAPGQTKTVNLQIHWDESENSDRYIGMVDLVHLTLTAAQLD